MNNLPASPAIPGDLSPNPFIQVRVSGSGHFISRSIYHICGITLQADQGKKKAADLADPTAKTKGRWCFCLIHGSKSLPSFKFLFFCNFHLTFYLNAAWNFLRRMMSAATCALQKYRKSILKKKKKRSVPSSVSLLAFVSSILSYLSFSQVLPI